MSAYVPIRRLLVANRGEIARRIMRTARGMGIATVAVYSDADADSPHVAEADLSVRLAGTSPSETYLRSALILDAASRTGADAIHPGYGHLSESGDFARVVTGAGHIWVGPPPSAIDAMASKVGSKELMRSAGVATLPSITVDEHRLPDIEAVAELGWPVLVKASAGSAGRGMRVVWGPSELAGAVIDARREAESDFGDGTVFLERYLRDPRHVEVQVLADAYGDTVALFERECSIQRGRRSIIEEAPSPFVSPELRTRLSDAAVTAAKEIGYVNAGTVEFLVDSDGEPYFLEMNTRLEVEHPVTEAVSELDLVRLQLLIAGGAHLPPEVHEAVAAGPWGHAVEARLYAEDPADGWLPTTGTLHRFEVGTGPAPGTASGPGTSGLTPGVRVDSGVVSGQAVTVHNDPLLAKVVVHAPSRAEAAAALASTLAWSRIHGVTTNRDLLVRILRHPGFVGGSTDTGFLEHYGLEELATPLADHAAVQRFALAAALADQAPGALADQAPGARPDPEQDALPDGSGDTPSDPQFVSYLSSGGGGSVPISVAFRIDRTGGAVLAVEVDGEPVDVELGAVAPDRVVLTVDGVTRHLLVDRHGPTAYVDGPEGSAVLDEVGRFRPATR